MTRCSEWRWEIFRAHVSARGYYAERRKEGVVVYRKVWRDGAFYLGAVVCTVPYGSIASGFDKEELAVRLTLGEVEGL